MTTQAKIMADLEIATRKSNNAKRAIVRDAATREVARLTQLLIDLSNGIERPVAPAKTAKPKTDRKVTGSGKRSLVAKHGTVDLGVMTTGLVLRQIRKTAREQLPTLVALGHWMYHPYDPKSGYSEEQWDKLEFDRYYLDCMKRALTVETWKDDARIYREVVAECKKVENRLFR